MRFRELKKLYEKYERILIPGMLVVGLLVDFVTFRSIELETAFVLLVGHVVLAGLTMTFISFHDSRKLGHGKLLRYIRLAAPLVLQFSFGALLSASFIFYWFGGTFAVSWPFILVVAALMISNETFRDYYLNPIIQIGVYTFLLFTVIAVIVPFIAKSIEPWTFLLAGIITTVMVVIYVQFLSVSLKSILFQRKYILYAVVSVIIFVNVLYILNVIPPAPLSVRHVDVYHSVNRMSDGYHLVSEEYSFFEKLIPGKTIHATAGQTITVFSSIFAPKDVHMITLHKWEKYDEDKRKWMNKGEFSFSLIGGRDAGYRGYTNKAVSPGKWRVRIKTLQGQTIGQVKFNVERVSEAPTLHTLIK
jgi:hypothetical protein